jgi:hypothetical protein
MNFLNFVSKGSAWLLAGLLLLTGLAFNTLAQANEEASTAPSGAKQVYLYTHDFPPARLGQVPPPAEVETQFLADLNKALLQQGGIELSATEEAADYTVDVRCGGIVHCSLVELDFYSPNHQFLSAVKLKGRPCPMKQVDTATMASSIAQTMAKQITAMETEGRYGVYDESKHK